ncbi:hypothetical protein AAT17_11630 [Nonlabens sp. MIC269]|uniref:hypothetical protein n=1 Tax=Nonlabens sp. MIC269 TaxID=1476901 RepID=UPI000722C436|nr:hypothetical protein [Nonlabens sp. MIC269]ALM21839.1 hypothetical protein AAT17_11630 [Nonlabens sp. MIC269]
MKVIRIILFFALVLVHSCISNKTKIKGETCRPEKDRFDYKGETLNHSDKLNFNKLYLSENGERLGFGFMEDGRLLVEASRDGFSLKDKFGISDLTYKKANNIGYWKIVDDRLYLEYFSCSNSGMYLKKEGVIKEGKIILEKVIHYPFRKEIRETVYNLSEFSFSE